MRNFRWMTLAGVLALMLAACAPITMEGGSAGGTVPAPSTSDTAGAPGGDATPDVMATPSLDAATTPVMGGTAGDSPSGGSDDEATTTDVTGDNTGAGNEAQTPATTETNEIIIPDDAEMLVGTWRMGESLLRFDADGSYQAASAAGDFDTDAAQRGTWSMAGGVLTVTPGDATVCEGQPGSYRVGMNEAGDSFAFTLEDDACTDRVGMMDNMEVTRQTSD